MRTNNANRFSTELTFAMGDTDLEAQVTSTAGGPASPCYLIIDHDQPTKAEIILFDGAFDGTTFRTTALANRYLQGSAASSGITHDVGAKVISAPLGVSLNDIWDDIDAHQAAANPHSGSASDTELSAHTGASNPHSGSASDTDLANHEADTTDVHGIADASSLAADDQPAARISTTAIDGFPNSTAQRKDFVDVDYDNDNMTDAAVSATGNPNYFTVNTPGLYLVTGALEWDADASGHRSAQIRVNGAIVAADSSAGTTNLETGNSNNVHTQHRLAAGDQVELWAIQNSGGTLFTLGQPDQNYFAIVRLST